MRERLRGEGRAHWERKLEEARYIACHKFFESRIPRTEYRLTAAGRAELERWQKRPIVGDDVIRGVDELMLRFGFMDESLGPAHSLRFLAALERELSGYIPTLRAYLEDHGAQMPLSGRLALESGIIGYESLLRWAQDAIATYENKKEERKRL